MKENLLSVKRYFSPGFQVTLSGLRNLLLAESKTDLAKAFGRPH